MPLLEPQFGIRDYLCYLLPGIVSLSGFLVWNPKLFEIFQNNVLASTIVVLVAGYLAGHICKLFGEIVLKPIRRSIGFNPHQNALDQEKDRWSDSFRESLLEKLKKVWGEEIIDQELKESSHNIILLCWYDTFKTPSKGHDEVDRYIALYNLCMAMIPASIILAISCAIKGMWVIFFISLAAIITFAKYWYHYEIAFCRSILRIWYTQNLKRLNDLGYNQEFIKPDLSGLDQANNRRRASVSQANQQQMPEMTATELKQRLEGGEQLQIIDVREPNEYAIARIPGSKHIPLGQVVGRMSEIDPDMETVVHCKMGGRSAKAIEALKRAGFTGRLTNLKGGITAWSNEVDPSVPKY